MAEQTMLDKVKLYFGISDQASDALLSLIIAQSELLIEALNIDPSLELPMCVEDYSTYLKSGATSYEVSQPSDGISKYSKGLQDLIRMSMKARVYG